MARADQNLAPGLILRRASRRAASPPSFWKRCWCAAGRSTSSSTARQARRGLATLAERDRALARRIVATVLRRLGTLRRLIGDLLSRGLPAEAPRVESALLIGAAQILFLDVPDHAAVDLSVRLVQADRRDARYAGLVNAVLRRLAARTRTPRSPTSSRSTSTPRSGCWRAGRKTYGAETAHAIALANRAEPPLDLTVKADPGALGGDARRHRHCPPARCGSPPQDRSRRLPGYGEGAWWVQDAAAALPARLFGDLAGRTVADLCAAPGGKTAQLVARRRDRHRGRPRGTPDGAVAREPRPARP